jgi:hypothetical protein
MVAMDDYPAVDDLISRFLTLCPGFGRTTDMNDRTLVNLVRDNGDSLLFTFMATGPTARHKTRLKCTFKYSGSSREHILFLRSNVWTVENSEVPLSEDFFLSFVTA